jgi:hypothetical protein
MKVSELLRILLWPLIGLCIFFSLQMFVTYYAQGASSGFDYLMNLMDLREERTIGTWFQSLLFVAAGVSFFMISRHPDFTKTGKIFLALLALGFCFLSADEALALHEFMGFHFEQITGIVDDTALEQRGYAWVLLYAPAAVAVFILFFWIYGPLFRNAGAPSARRLFALAWGAVVIVFLFEVAEAWAVHARKDVTGLMTCFEETFELAVLMLFYAANLRIAEDAGL